MSSPGYKALATDAPPHQRRGGQRSWRVGHYQPWRTARRCTGPEPSSSLQSDQRTLGKRPLDTSGEQSFAFLVRALRWLIAPASPPTDAFLLLSTSGKGWRPFDQPPAFQGERNYLSSTLAPASSSFFLAASASALFRPSLTGFGAPSTRSLASLRPRPVISRTALMTDTFWAPASSSCTVNSVFSSAAAAAPPPPPPAAGAAIAAADTPNFSSIALTRSLSSITDMLSRAVRNASLSNAMLIS